MKAYVWISFAVMGLGYYQVSGGADFVPAHQQIALADSVEPEIVTRAQTTTLLSLSSSNVQPVPEPSVIQTVAVEPNEPDVFAVPVPDPEPQIDIRQVAGTRVNMRMGPSTDFDVITTLDGGTKLEVLSIDAQGWANVSTELGVEGWMAERLLTEPQT